MNALPEQAVPAKHLTSNQHISKVFDTFLDRVKRKLNVIIHNLSLRQRLNLSWIGPAQIRHSSWIWSNTTLD